MNKFIIENKILQEMKNINYANEDKIIYLNPFNDVKDKDWNEYVLHVIIKYKIIEINNKISIENEQDKQFYEKLLYLKEDDFNKGAIFVLDGQFVQSYMDPYNSFIQSKIENKDYIKITIMYLT